MNKNIFIMLIVFFSSTVLFPAEIYIRLNQLGFLPNDLKTAVIFSDTDIGDNSYKILDMFGDEALVGDLNKLSLKFSKFNYSYSIDFSTLQSEGKYIIDIDGIQSYPFSINTKIYNSVIDSIMLFFKVQRCGYTNPLFHKVCHPYDATSLIENGITINKTYDVTGGWHDAGDYIKFLNTAAYVTYTLIFAYEFDPVKFGFDNDKNSVPDVLDEAKIGLDWLLRLNYENKKFITQVQDLKDHAQGWRMPEDDKIALDRPAYLGIGKNLIGIYSATLAMAARVWKEKIKYSEFSDKCLKIAEHFYSIRNEVPDIDSSGSGVYLDKRFHGKLGLGAIELYKTTGKRQYLLDAIEQGDLAGSDFWWSWGDINAFLHYRLADFEPRFTDYLKKNVEYFNIIKNKNLFGTILDYGWGSNNTILGIALQSILLKKISSNFEYDSLIIYQRDYIFGRNQWGVSFISNIGFEFAKNFHSQLAYLNNSFLPGAVAAGPVSKNSFSKYKIEIEGKDRFNKFQTTEAVYFDDRMDYVTNEPTITANATALFVIGWFSERK